jgi:outer membrane protein
MSRIFSLIFIFCCGLAPVKAASDTLYLSFRDAVLIGLERNVDYQTRLNNQDVLKMEKMGAYMTHLPRLTLNSNVYSQTGQQFQQVEGELIVTNVTNNIISSGLNVNMNLFNSGRRIYTSQANRFFERGGEYGLDRSAQVVVYTVAERYLQVLLDKELLNIAEANLQNQKEQLRQIRGFVDGGLRTISDLYNQEAEVARLETMALNAKIALQNDVMMLSQTLQLEAGEIPVLQELQIDGLRENWKQNNLDQLYNTALQNRSDLKELEFNKEGARKQMKASKAGYFPVIGAYFNYNSFYTSLDNRAFNEQFLNIYPTRTAGMNVSIPIFHNFDNKVIVERAKVNQSNQELQYHALRRNLYQEINMAVQNFEAAQGRERATQLQVQAAQEALKVVSERYAIGLSNFVDLSLANQQSVAAQSDNAQARYNLYFQELVMEFVLGTLDVQAIRK